METVSSGRLDEMWEESTVAQGDVAIPVVPEEEVVSNGAHGPPLTMRMVSEGQLTNPYRFTAEDAADPSMKRIGGQCCAKCVSEDSFWYRLWGRLKLDHISADNSPGYILLKAALVCVLCLLIDKGTKNPDSVSTVFLGLLGLASYLHLGKQMAIQTLTSGLMGAVVGTLVSAATYVPLAMDPNNWMLLLSVPWSVVTTLYLLFFFGLDGPANMAAGQFSALFVIVAKFTYPPIDAIVPLDDPRRLIWQTLLVRVIAMLTGVISAYIVNMVVSASAPLAIYKITMYFTERLVWRSAKHRLDPVDSVIQLNFQKVVQQIQLAPVASDATNYWVFSQTTREEIQTIARRANAMFRFLTWRSFLELFARSAGATKDELMDVERLIEFSKRNAKGDSLRGLSLEEELAELETMPGYLHLQKCLLKSILIDLASCKVKYRPDDKISAFCGVI